MKHLFNLIEGLWGEQPDLETPPLDEDKPAFKRFKTSSSTPSTASISSTTSSSIPKQPPTKHFIPPWEVRALVGIPTNQHPSYELCESETKKYYCPTCGNAMGNHDSTLTHVRCSHLNIVLACHYCNFVTPSFATLKKHVFDKQAGLPIQAVPISKEETNVLRVTSPK